MPFLRCAKSRLGFVRALRGTARPDRNAVSIEAFPVVLFIDRMVPNCLFFSCFSIIADFTGKSSI